MTIEQVVSLAMSGSIPLLTVVLGLVQFTKRVGLQGNVLIIVSMLIGLAFGASYLYLTAKPLDTLGMFLCLIYGILIGLIASGIYDVASGIANKAAKS